MIAVVGAIDIGAGSYCSFLCSLVAVIARVMLDRYARVSGLYTRAIGPWYVIVNYV